MRSLARQLVIFMLLGMGTGLVGLPTVLFATEGIRQTGDFIAIAFFGALVGGAGGIVIWMFYRLIRFAVNG